MYHGPNTNPSKPQTNPNSQSENLFCNIESSEATGNVSPGTGKSHVEELDNRLENHPIEQQPFSFREWPCPKSSKKILHQCQRIVEAVMVGHEGPHLQSQCHRVGLFLHNVLAAQKSLFLADLAPTILGIQR